MANLLVISPFPTWPPNAGNRARLYHLLEFLKEEGINIHFLYLDRYLQADLKVMKGLYHDFIRIEYVKKTLMSRIGLVLCKHVKGAKKILASLDQLLASAQPLKKILRPLEIDAWYSSRLHRAIEGVASHMHFNAVMVEYVYLSRALELFPTSLKIIDTHDVMSVRETLFDNQRLVPIGFFTTPEEEKKALDRADYALAIQDDDRRYLEGLGPRATIMTVGHVAVGQRPGPPLDEVGPEEAKGLLYIASDSAVNRHAVGLFMDHIWPRLRSVAPSVKLTVGGAICNFLAQRHKGDEGFDLLYEVQDLNKLYAMDYIVINPVQVGTGLKIKNIEALFASRPLVTTSIGAQGLDTSKGAFIVADRYEEAANSILALYHVREKRCVLSRKARSFAEQYIDGHRKAIKKLSLLIKKGDIDDQV